MLNKRFFRNKRGLSSAISGVILVSISIAYAFVAVSWFGSISVTMMSLEELEITECQWATDASYVYLTLRNVGVQSATIGSVQVNKEAVQDYSIIEGEATINPYRRAVIRVNYNFSPSTNYEFLVTTKRLTPIRYLVVSGSTFLPRQPTLHYINTTSNVDSSPDIGSHSNFANQQAGPDSLFDVLTEGDTGAGLIDIIQYATSSSSNVDSKEDDGLETNFVNAQDTSPDSDFMTLQEENLGGGGGGFPSIRSKDHSCEPGSTSSHDVRLPSTIEAGDTILAVFVCDDNEWVTWENEGTDWNVIYEEDAGGSGPTMSIAWKKAVGNEDGTTITVTTGGSEESVHISYSIQNAADPNISPPEASSEASGYGGYPDPGPLSPSGGSNDYLWFAFYGCDDDDMAYNYPSTYFDNRETYESSGGSGTCAIGAATREYTSSNDNPGYFSISSEEWEAATIAVYPGSSSDYELDFEYQWTSADFDETTEEVCIYVETASQSGENLVAYEWSGTAWQTLGTLSSDGWNNFTASYLTGATYTINIRDQDKSNDASQSTWNIDCIITNCSSTETNYELDVEVQFTDVYVGEGYEEICIYMESATGENLDLYIWNGESWDQLASALVPNQWNNMTRTITADTVTLRFLGTIETADIVQDTWEIDCVLLYAPA